MLDFTNDLEMAEQNALSCVLLEKEITRSDIDNYYKNMKSLLKSFESGRFNWGYIPEIKEELSKNEGKVRLLVSRAGIKAIQYFTQYNWPSGFLYAQGGLRFSPCDGNKAGFTVIPKQLFLKVAVIEYFRQRSISKG